MAAQLGLSVPKDGSVSPAALRALGATWASFTIDALAPDQARYCRALTAAGITPFPRVDDDTLRAFGELYDPDTQDHAATWIADTFTGWCPAIGSINEPDWQGRESSPHEHAWVNRLNRALRRELPPSMSLIGPALVSGNPHWLDDLDLSLLDGLDLHLYGKVPPTWQGDTMTGWLPDALHGYIRRMQELGHLLPISMSELGLSSVEAGEALQADYCSQSMAWLASDACPREVRMACWFAYHDHDGFGLMRADGSAKPSAAAFRAAAQVPEPVDRCEEYRQALLRTIAYVQTTPQRQLKRQRLRELLGVPS